MMKNKKHLIKTTVMKGFIIYVTCFSLFMSHSNVYADEATNISLGASPSVVYNKNIIMGSKLEIPLKLYNKDTNASVNTSVKFNVNLTVESGDTNKENEVSWVTFDKNNFSMNSSDKILVNTIINVPNGATIGEHTIYVDVARTMVDASKSKTSVETHIKIPIIFNVTDKAGKMEDESSYQVDSFDVDFHSEFSLKDTKLKSLWNSLFTDPIVFKFNGTTFCELPHSSNVSLEKVITNGDASPSKYISIMNDIDKNTILSAVNFNNNTMVVNGTSYLLFPNSEIMNDVSEQLVGLKNQLKMDYGNDVPLQALLTNIKCISNINYSNCSFRLSNVVKNSGSSTIVPSGNFYLFGNKDGRPSEILKGDYGFTIIKASEEKTVVGDIGISNLECFKSYKVASELLCKLQDDSVNNSCKIVVLNIRLMILVFTIVVIILTFLIIHIIKKRGKHRCSKIKSIK